ncbi:unnamed protein product [Calypogeia fissa]
MGADAETNRQTMGAGVPQVAKEGKVVNDPVEAKISMGLDAASKPAGVGGGAAKMVDEKGLTDDEIAATLAAASEKLQAAHQRDQNKRKGVAGCFRALNPKRLFSRFRDFYINTCMMAAEKGDFVDLVAGHHAYYGETAMSRNMSQRREKEHEEMMNASLSRQISISLSRQASQSKQSQSGPVMMRNSSTGIPGLSRSASTGIPALNRNASTGIQGLPRQTSSGIPGLNRQSSTGIKGLNRHSSGVGRSTFGRSLSSKKKAESNLFAAGRDTFLQERAADLSSMKPGEDKVNKKN